jgi:hypothetical protein
MKRSLMVALAAGVVLSPVAPAQTGSRDLSGVWRYSGRTLTLSNDVPTMTPWGQAKFNATKPGYGPRMVPPALGNDPQGKCDPLGIPRLIFFNTTPVEFVQTSDRLVQFYEWGHVWRTVWTDGRALPKDASDDPTWLGYSAGKWDGDTLVVESAGFDERSWLDHFGNPHSDEMRLEERYRRADKDTIELTMTINDPKTYTKPWVSEKKTFKLQPRREIREIFCVPSEEEAFNKRIRDPAAGKTGK